MLPFTGKKGRWDAWGVGFYVCGSCVRVCVCVADHRYKWRWLKRSMSESKGEAEEGVDLFSGKGHPNSSNFQVNQRGTGWTLIAWSEGCERLLKGYRGHHSPARITCPSSLRMTYPRKGRRRVRQRGVGSTSVLRRFCLGEANAAFTENRHGSSGQDRN